MISTEAELWLGITVSHAARAAQDKTRDEAYYCILFDLISQQSVNAQLNLRFFVLYRNHINSWRKWCWEFPPEM